MNNVTDTFIVDSYAFERKKTNMNPLMLPIIIVVIGILSYLEILYFPLAATIVMTIYMILLTWLSKQSGPDFPD